MVYDVKDLKELQKKQLFLHFIHQKDNVNSNAQKIINLLFSVLDKEFNDQHFFSMFFDLKNVSTYEEKNNILLDYIGVLLGTSREQNQSDEDYKRVLEIIAKAQNSTGSVYDISSIIREFIPKDLPFEIIENPNDLSGDPSYANISVEIDSNDATEFTQKIINNIVSATKLQGITYEVKEIYDITPDDPDTYFYLDPERSYQLLGEDENKLEESYAVNGHYLLRGKVEDPENDYFTYSYVDEIKIGNLDVPISNISTKEEMLKHVIWKKTKDPILIKQVGSFSKEDPYNERWLGIIDNEVMEGQDLRHSAVGLFAHGDPIVIQGYEEKTYQNIFLNYYFEKNISKWK